MNHWTVLPVVLPLFAALLLLFGARRPILFDRVLSLGSTIGLLILSVALLYSTADGNIQVYLLGDWPPPYGIVLVLDSLSGLMLALTAFLALFALLYAMNGADTTGKNFHMLFQFQLVGLNGAFLTGDLFNLFVFFEILLLASYALVLHGSGRKRSIPALHYVVLNLAGSALFLIGIGMIYGITGTLNMADLAVKAAAVGGAHVPVLRSGGLLLLVVFALKAALFPLYFWLPDAYRAADAPVAALFAIMTKVGVYATLRVFTLIFGPGPGSLALAAAPWLLAISLLTMVLGIFGVLASRDLRTMIGYLIIVSVGTLFTAISLFSQEGIGSALFYLIHTTLVTGGLFLLVDLIMRQRGSASDRLEAAAPMVQGQVLGVLFFVGAVSVAGMPPLSGFPGKLMILQAARNNPAVALIWGVILLTGLLALVALSRAGSILFWKALKKKPAGESVRMSMVAPVLVLFSCSLLLMIFADPASRFLGLIAGQLMEPSNYIRAVLYEGI
jgi:multicomponent K+:H+ antiporter subunit D